MITFAILLLLVVAFLVFRLMSPSL